MINQKTARDLLEALQSLEGLNDKSEFVMGNSAFYQRIKPFMDEPCVLSFRRSDEPSSVMQVLLGLQQNLFDLDKPVTLPFGRAFCDTLHLVFDKFVMNRVFLKKSWGNDEQEDSHV